MTSLAPLVLDGRPLEPREVESVARGRRSLAVGDAAMSALKAARAVIDDKDGSDEPIYGINTGFGSLARHRISPREVRAVQHNLLRSHAAGVGTLLEPEVVRAMLVLLAASLCRGHSGVRPDVVSAIVGLLERGVTPVVPSRGSVGASGDLAPLSHCGLVLIGEGEAIVEGRRLPGADALRQAGLAPIELDSKEGLALINGTHMMAAIAVLALGDVDRLLAAAVRANAASLDACRATDAFLDARLHALRRQPGQVRVAARLRSLVAGSQIIAAHKEHDPRVQDPYCLRASPQVLGAVVDAIDWARGVVLNELGAVTDNPIVFPAGEPKVVSGGNFHGMPLAIALDTLAIALCHLAGIAERRIYWLLAASDSENPVNLYLSPQPGLHSGLMIVQYTAAACCNELQTLATPASVANISTSAGQEDYNSMGATSAHQVRRAVELTRDVIAAELLVMTEAMEYQRPLRSGRGVEETLEVVRRAVPRLTADRPPAPDLAAIAELIGDGAFGESLD